MDSFSFMVIDQSNIVSVYENIPFKNKKNHFRFIDPVEILSIVQNNNLRFNRFEQVNISLDHESFTYIPKDIFENSAWYDYLNFVSTGVKKDDVVSSPADNSVCVFIYPLSIRKLLSTLYPATQVRHLSEALAAFLQNEVTEDPAVFILLHDDYQYLIVFENKNITLVNRYFSPTAKDRLYYILLACKHRRLNPRKVNLKMIGDKKAVEDLQNELMQYFIHVHKIDWKNGWRLPLTVKNPMELFEFYCMHYAYNRREV